MLNEPFSVEFYRDSTRVVSSGDLFDKEFSGGRLGVYCLSQKDVTWSKLQYTCTSQFVNSCYVINALQ